VKTFVRLSLLALVVAALAFGLTRWLAPHPHADADEMAWMKTEFHLTPAQTAAIEKLHEDYSPVCMEHCRLIREARARLTALDAANQRATPDYAAAQAEMTRLKAVCHDATQKHLKAVAAQMSPDEGRRFLDLTIPKLAGQSHDAPLDPR
jgi:Spy/CpxP family protein refolding chaperone